MILDFHLDEATFPALWKPTFWLIELFLHGESLEHSEISNHIAILSVSLTVVSEPHECVSQEVVLCGLPPICLCIRVCLG